MYQRLITLLTHLRKRCSSQHTNTHTTTHRVPVVVMVTVSNRWGGSAAVFALIENPDLLLVPPNTTITLHCFTLLFFPSGWLAVPQSCPSTPQTSPRPNPPAPLHALSLLSHNSSISWLADSDSSNEEKGKMKGEEREGTLNERKRGEYQRRV